MEQIALMSACLAALLGLGLAVLLLRLSALRRKLAETAAQRDRSLAAEASSTRMLRLSAKELRDTALTLLGHVDKLRDRSVEDVATHANAVAAATAQVLALADDLQDTAVPCAESRVLREQKLSIGALLQDAIDAISVTIEPGRRNWRVAPELTELTLLADRRALSQTFLRVLGNAARFTRDDDWIDLALERHDTEISIVIADEGAGLASPTLGASPHVAGSRGIGLGLALARALMEAHGGSLALEAAARIGTRVTLAFPVQRVLVQQQQVNV